jgi:ribose 5-phosphate isomerase A
MSDISKINAAIAASDYVEDGMTLGLGTGSTAAHFVRLLAQRVRDGVSVKGVPTSEATRRLAEAAGVPLVNPDHVGRIHLAIDGADEVDPENRLIKGGGGALLREKIIARAADHFIVIVDEGKVVETLGAFPLPVEVTPFAVSMTARKVYEALRASGCAGWDITIRNAGAASKPFLTDGGNQILDCRCESIPDPETLAVILRDIPGVVDHGLFINMARTVIIGGLKGAQVREA